MPNTTDFYINGQWVAPDSLRGLDVINPSTEEVCATISLGSQADVDAAVGAARAAFAGWSQSTKSERLALLERILEVYKARAGDMAEAISTEMGAPIDLSKTSQVGAGIWHISNFITALKDFDFERPLGDHAPNDRIIHEAVGVVGMITPWNWPMNQVTLKTIPALAAGCTMVLKPSEIAPLSALLFAEILDEAGVPAGVFNLVNGDGAGVGTMLTSHPGVDAISFTGSTRAGIAISKSAADTLKPVHLELGGKGANVIFADADEKAVKRGVQHCFNNTGQSCNAPTRMLVERAIYDQAVEIAADVAEKTAVGMAADPGRHIGPLVSQAQYDKVQALIETGIAEGARLVAGGPGRPEGFNRGYFVRPTVFADVSNDMTIAREEIFGPVLSIIPFEDEAEALAIANDVQYGLTGYLWTNDVTRALRFSDALEAGMIWVNSENVRHLPTPFGGVKSSGIGRDGGQWSFEFYMETKHIGIATGQHKITRLGA